MYPPIGNTTRAFSRAQGPGSPVVAQITPNASVFFVGAVVGTIRYVLPGEVVQKSSGFEKAGSRVLDSVGLGPKKGQDLQGS